MESKLPDNNQPNLITTISQLPTGHPLSCEINSLFKTMRPFDMYDQQLNRVRCDFYATEILEVPRKYFQRDVPIVC